MMAHRNKASAGSTERRSIFETRAGRSYLENLERLNLSKRTKEAAAAAVADERDHPSNDGQ